MTTRTVFNGSRMVERKIKKMKKKVGSGIHEIKLDKMNITDEPIEIKKDTVKDKQALKARLRDELCRTL